MDVVCSSFRVYAMWSICITYTHWKCKSHFACASEAIRSRERAASGKSSQSSLPSLPTFSHAHLNTLEDSSVIGIAKLLKQICRYSGITSLGQNFQEGFCLKYLSSFLLDRSRFKLFILSQLHTRYIDNLFFFTKWIYSGSALFWISFETSGCSFKRDDSIIKLIGDGKVFISLLWKSLLSTSFLQ